jgi:hypothetical protein
LSDATLPTTTPTNGQIPIGNGTTYVPATITAGSNITVTNGAGTITIAATAGSSGTVTSITAGTGLSGGTITTSGTIALVTTLGAVGTYAFCINNSSSISPGGTIFGAYLSYSDTNNSSNGSPSGTWRAMGDGASGYSTLWIRIA